MTTLVGLVWSAWALTSGVTPVLEAEVSGEVKTGFLEKSQALQLAQEAAMRKALGGWLPQLCQGAPRDVCERFHKLALMDLDRVVLFTVEERSVDAQKASARLKARADGERAGALLRAAHWLATPRSAAPLVTEALGTESYRATPSTTACVETLQRVLGELGFSFKTTPVVTDADGASAKVSGEYGPLRPTAAARAAEISHVVHLKLRRATSRDVNRGVWAYSADVTVMSARALAVAGRGRVFRELAGMADPVAVPSTRGPACGALLAPALVQALVETARQDDGLPSRFWLVVEDVPAPQRKELAAGLPKALPVVGESQLGKAPDGRDAVRVAVRREDADALTTQLDGVGVAGVKLAIQEMEGAVIVVGVAQ
ncbi:MAG: hypothetical protein AB2A00_43055 [Myxococcota bacterium]